MFISIIITFIIIISIIICFLLIIFILHPGGLHERQRHPERGPRAPAREGQPPGPPGLLRFFFRIKESICLLLLLLLLSLLLLLLLLLL